MKKLWAWLKGMIDAKLIKFIIVGLINTVVGMGLIFGFYNLLGMGYWLSSALGYVLASVVSFFLNKYFTFGNKTRSAAQILKFALNIAVCYLIAYGIAQPLVTRLFSTAAQALRDNIALLVGMGLFTGLNYFGQRLFVFREKPAAPGGEGDAPAPPPAK